MNKLNYDSVVTGPYFAVFFRDDFPPTINFPLENTSVYSGVAYVISPDNLSDTHYNQQK